MKIPLTVCLMALSITIFSQQSSLSFSNDFKIAEKEYHDQTVTHAVYHNNNFYTVTNSSVGLGKWLFTKLYDMQYAVTISMYDRDMNLIKETKLDNGDKNFGPLIPELLFFNKKLYLAYFKTDNKSSFNLYLSAIDDKQLTAGDPKKICTIEQENVGIFKLESVISGGLIYFATSPDNSKLLVACKSSPNKLQTFILDKDLNVIKKAATPSGFSSFDIPSAVVTNDDKVCMIITSEQETKLICFNSDGRKTETRFNPIGNLTPYNTKAKVSKDGASIFIYSTASLTGTKNPWCMGLITAQLNCSTLKPDKPKAYEFSAEFIQDLCEKGAGGKHKKYYLMYNFLPDLIELDNGTIAITGSPTASGTSTSTSAPNMNGQTSTVSTSVTEVGPVLVFYPSVEGNTFETVVVPRKIVFTKTASSGSGAIQVVQSPSVSYSSTGYFADKIGNEIVIVYSDNTENLNSDGKLITTKKAGDLALAEALISSDKKLSYRKMIKDDLPGRSTYYLGSVVPSSSNSIIFPIGKEGMGFNARKTFYTNWCFLEIKK
ncbi:MAG: hypothetical protein HYR66_00955 [Sphingobacteriales bacterium]|nr:hypothetical protein [Sphingobacteriales bacterium]MBI3719236.1 hypothetical protein [Sphingobacteriales bacterium]